jgi:hypothetical protein
MAFGLTGLLAGIVLLLLGFFLVFLFPTTTVHQTEKFGVLGIVLGVLFLLIGGALIFL